MKRFLIAPMLLAAFAASMVSAEAIIVVVEDNVLMLAPPEAVAMDSVQAFSVAPVPAALTVEVNLVKRPYTLIGLNVSEKVKEPIQVAHHAEVIGAENIDPVGGGDSWLFGNT